jgi:hypothetical protein
MRPGGHAQLKELSFELLDLLMHGMQLLLRTAHA